MYNDSASKKDKTNFFFFNDTATTEIYTLSLHDALPIYPLPEGHGAGGLRGRGVLLKVRAGEGRSEEHTSELQSPCNIVCRLLLEKKQTRLTGRALCSDDYTTSSVHLSRYLKC